jgi:hypothetical protein
MLTEPPLSLVSLSIAPTHERCAHLNPDVSYVQSIALRSWRMVRAHVLGAAPALYLLAPCSLHVCCGCQYALCSACLHQSVHAVSVKLHECCCLCAAAVLQMLFRPSVQISCPPPGGVLSQAESHPAYPTPAAAAAVLQMLSKPSVQRGCQQRGP